MDAVNKNIQSSAARLLEYINENRGKKIILGQHTQTMQQEELSCIHKATGHLPALCGFELLAYSPNIRYDTSGAECLDEVNAAAGTLQKAWEWAQQGGLVTMTWHWFSPLGGSDKSFFTCNTDFSAERAAEDGTPENAAFLSDMDYMAGLLRPFSDAQIPILWRPFHENEGGWFWWGNCDKSVVQKLYRIMFERYTQHFHLDDLLWVFNSPKKECYPGDDVVDILSRDLYPEAHMHTAHEKELYELKQVTSADKPCALAEIGTIPDVYAITDKHLDWSWFMTWSKRYCLSEEFTYFEDLKKAYSCENAVTLESLPEF